MDELLKAFYGGDQVVITPDHLQRLVEECEARNDSVAGLLAAAIESVPLVYGYWRHVKRLYKVLEAREDTTELMASLIARLENPACPFENNLIKFADPAKWRETEIDGSATAVIAQPAGDVGVDEGVSSPQKVDEADSVGHKIECCHESETAPSVATMKYMRRRARRFLRRVGLDSPEKYVLLAIAILEKDIQGPTIWDSWIHSEIVFGSDDSVEHNAHSRGRIEIPIRWSRDCVRRERHQHLWNDHVEKIKGWLATGSLMRAEFAARICLDLGDLPADLESDRLAAFLCSANCPLILVATEILEKVPQHIGAIRPDIFAKGLVSIEMPERERLRKVSGRVGFPRSWHVELALSLKRELTFLKSNPWQENNLEQLGLDADEYLERALWILRFRTGEMAECDLYKMRSNWCFDIGNRSSLFAWGARSKLYYDWYVTNWLKHIGSGEFNVYFYEGLCQLTPCVVLAASDATAGEKGYMNDYLKVAQMTNLFGDGYDYDEACEWIHALMFREILTRFEAGSTGGVKSCWVRDVLLKLMYREVFVKDGRIARCKRGYKNLIAALDEKDLLKTGATDWLAKLFIDEMLSPARIERLRRPYRDVSDSGGGQSWQNDKSEWLRAAAFIAVRNRISIGSKQLRRLLLVMDPNELLSSICNISDDGWQVVLEGGKRIPRELIATEEFVQLVLTTVSSDYSWLQDRVTRIRDRVFNNPALFNRMRSGLKGIIAALEPSELVGLVTRLPDDAWEQVMDGGRAIPRGVIASQKFVQLALATVSRDPQIHQVPVGRIKARVFSNPALFNRIRSRLKSIIAQMNPSELLNLVVKLPDEEWEQVLDGGRAIPRGLISSQEFLKLAWELSGSDESGRILSRIFRNPGVPSRLFKRLELLYTTDLHDSQLTLLAQLLRDGIRCPKMDSDELFGLCTCTVQEIFPLALEYAQTKGFTSTFALRLLESRFPPALETAEAFFNELTPKGGQALRQGLMLCDSPVSDVQNFGLGFLERHWGEISESSLVRSLSESTDRGPRLFVAGLAAQDLSLGKFLETFDTELLAERNRHRRAKELVKFRRTESTLSTSAASRLKPPSPEYLETMKDLALGSIRRDQDWALAELVNLQRGGATVAGLKLHGPGEDC